MAIVQINDPNRRGTGHRFGESLGLGLEELAGHKVKQLQRQGAQERNFHALLQQGFQEPAALAYSQLPDETLRDFFRENLLRAGTGAQNQPQQQTSPYEQLLGNLNAGPQPQQQQPQPWMSGGQQQTMQQLMQGILPQGQQPGNFNLYNGPVGPQGQMPGNPVTPQYGNTPQPQQPMMNIGTLKPGQVLGQNPQQPQTVQPPIQPQNIAQQSPQQATNQQSNDPFSQILNNPLQGARPGDRFKALKAALDLQNKRDYQDARIAEKGKDRDLKEREFMHQQEKLERPYYEKLLETKPQWESTLNDLDRVTNLINKGDIVNPTEDHMQRWLSGALKINLKDLRGADTEDFNKTVKSFVKNAKQWFGARITDRDLKVFMETLPELSMSHEGKMRIIASMRAAAMAQKIRYEGFEDLMRLNKGHLPPFAKFKVEQMVQSQLDELAKQFVAGDLVTPLSDAAVAGAKRNSWMRWAKAFLTFVFGSAKAIGGGLKATTEAVGNLVGPAATGLIKSGPIQ